MYEKYPYPPAAAPTMRVGSDARLLLSFGKKSRPAGRPLRVLDAGCGRGAGVLGAATMQRDVEFVGADLNRVALAEATQAAKARGLTNVRFATVDLMTLDGLDIPEGGFDVIVSSGVLHHLADPARGLARLRDALAPHGMLSLMVYGRDGRHPLYRTVRAIDMLAPRNLPIERRLEVARALVHAPQAEALFTGAFSDAPTMPDIELVDRYLHVNETSYNVTELLALLAQSGLRHVRWNEPEQWDPDAILPPSLRELAARMEPAARWSLVEALTHRPMLDLTCCHVDNAPRPPLTPQALPDVVLAVNPEASFSVETRCARGELRTEKVVVTRRRETLPLSAGPLAAASLVLREQTTTFRGAELLDALVGFGFPQDEVYAAVVELLRTEVLYTPHAVDA